MSDRVGKALETITGKIPNPISPKKPEIIVPLPEPVKVEKKMRDVISIDRVAKLHPKIRQEVANLITKAEEQFPITVAIRVVQGYRTYAEQDALYAQGRTKPGSIVTNARGGQSNHNFALAFDFALLYDKDSNGTYEALSWDLKEDFDKDKIADWMEVVKVFEDAGYEWGGRWKFFDGPHIQKVFGLTVAQMREKVALKKVDKDGYILI